MLTILLAETAVELIPLKIKTHPAVTKYASKRGKEVEKIILNSAYHHSAMQILEDSEKRGRPDIMHTFLILTLDSILNLEGKLEIIVHTINDNLIKIAPDTRIPKSYHRFIGLLEDLFERKSIPPEKPLLKLEQNYTLKEIIEDYKANNVRTIVFSQKGRLVNIYEYLKEMPENLLVIVGGFAKGDFSTDIFNIVDDCISIYKSHLKAWTVVAEILTAYRLVSTCD